MRGTRTIEYIQSIKYNRKFVHHRYKYLQRGEKEKKRGKKITACKKILLDSL